MSAVAAPAPDMPRIGPEASRNSEAARTCSVRASGQSVKISAVSAP